MPRTIERERLQKYLSGIGIGSRRKIENWISQGKITVDGKVAQLGDQVTQQSRISIDGRPIRGQRRKDKIVFSQRVILYNKPEGEICTRSDPKNRPTVFRNLPHLKDGRWVAVGRLDINSSGLMLFTNDGKLANYLMHPSTGIDREYLCRVYGKVDSSSIEQLKRGIIIDGELIRFLQINRQRGGKGSNAWYSVVVQDGKYREVRRLWEAVGCKISRLNRIRYGKVALPRGLKPGAWIELDSQSIQRISTNSASDSVLTPKANKVGKQYRTRAR